MAGVLAFIDESGQRSSSRGSSDHFVLSAVIVRIEDYGSIAELLAELREEVNRQRGDALHWHNISSHSQRLHLSQRIAGADFLALSAVIVCKRLIEADRRITDEDRAYLHTLRYLLERLSWMARAEDRQLGYVMSHVVRFKVQKLREYERKLHHPDCSIAWRHIMAPGVLSTPKKREQLQLADLVASAIGAAFNADRYGNSEPRYLEALVPGLRRWRQTRLLTSYGLKIHPRSACATPEYAWVTRL